MSIKIEDLTPKAQEAYASFKHLLDQVGIKSVVVGTLRTVDEQQALWFKGRDKNGKVIDKSKVVTNCDGIIHKSNHQSGNAFDLTFAKDNGAPYWPDPATSDGAQKWSRLGALAESVGLVWGGRFTPLNNYGIGWDPDHFEVGV